jgi:uncharacterized membrane protein
MTGRGRVGIDQGLVSLALPSLIVLLGAALRFFDLGAESYWYDEIRTLQVASAAFRTLAAEFLTSGRPPLYMFVMRAWLRVFGATEVATRSLSAFAGIASIAAIFTLGRELFGPKVAALSATLMAVSDFQIWYAQESRYYALYLLLSVLSAVFYVRSIERRRTRDVVLYAAATTLMCYAYSSGVFVLAAQSVHIITILCRQRSGLWKVLRTPWVLAHTGVYLLVFPLILAIFVAVRTGEFSAGYGLPDAGIGVLVLTPLRYVAGEYPGLRAVALAFIALIAGMGAFVLYVGRDNWLASIRQALASVQRLSSRKSELVLLLLWLGCPIVLQWGFSRILGRPYIFRYTIGASPALYLLLSLAMVTLGSALPELLVLGTIAILAVPGLWAYYTEDTRENWRDAAAYVQLHLSEGDPVIVPNRTHGVHAFGWYFDAEIRQCEAAGSSDEQEAIVAAAGGCAHEADRFWLVLREAFVPGKQLRESAWREAGLQLVEGRVFKGVLVYLFEKSGEGSGTGKPKPAGCLHHCSFPSLDGREGDAGGSVRLVDAGRRSIAHPDSLASRSPSTSRLWAHASGIPARRFRAKASGHWPLMLQAGGACTA